MFVVMERVGVSRQVMMQCSNLCCPHTEEHQHITPNLKRPSESPAACLISQLSARTESTHAMRDSNMHMAALTCAIYHRLGVIAHASETTCKER